MSMDDDEIPAVIEVHQHPTIEELARTLLALDVDEVTGRARPRGLRAERESSFNAAKAFHAWPIGKRMSGEAFLAAIEQVRRCPL